MVPTWLLLGEQFVQCGERGALSEQTNEWRASSAQSYVTVSWNEVDHVPGPLESAALTRQYSVATGSLLVLTWLPLTVLWMSSGPSTRLACEVMIAALAEATVITLTPSTTRATAPNGAGHRAPLRPRNEPLAA